MKFRVTTYFDDGRISGHTMPQIMSAEETLCFLNTHLYETDSIIGHVMIEFVKDGRYDGQ